MTTHPPNTILLNVRNRHELERPLEAGQDITPGMLIQYTSGALTVRPHSTAAGVPSPILVATEMPIRAGSGIDDPYNVDGEVVSFHVALSGDQLWMLAEAGSNVSEGDLLESAGDGTLQAATSGAAFRALQEVDFSASYSADRIRVEVL